MYWFHCLLSWHLSTFGLGFQVIRTTTLGTLADPEVWVWEWPLPLFILKNATTKIKKKIASLINYILIDTLSCASYLLYFGKEL